QGFFGDAMVISNCIVATTQNVGIMAIPNGAVVRNCTVSKAAYSGIAVYSGSVIDSQVTDCNTAKSSDMAGITLGSGYGVARGNSVRWCYVNGIRGSNASNVVENNVISGTLTAAQAPGVAIYAAAG